MEWLGTFLVAVSGPMACFTVAFIAAVAKRPPPPIVMRIDGRYIEGWIDGHVLRPERRAF
jgi:hypothetical protein